MTTAYSYVRFSSPDQAKGDSLRRQLAASQQYADQHGLTLDSTLTFHDYATSAFHSDNSATGKLRSFISAIDSGQIERGSYLLVESIDRLPPDHILKLLNLFASILSKGIHIVTLSDGKVYTEDSINTLPDLMYSIMIMSRAHEDDRIPQGDHIPTMRFIRTVRILIGFANALLLAIFTWIQFREVPFDRIVANSTMPILLWHGGLALYYASWYFGTKFDLNIQEFVYVGFPREGKVPVHGFMMVLILVVVGAVLLWTERDIQRFAIALDIFIVVDHLGWRYLIWLIKEVVCTSPKYL